MDTSKVQVFKTAGRLLTGENASYLLAEQMQHFNITRPLIVTDKGVLNAGIIDPVLEHLRSNEIERISIFSDITAEPETKTVEDCRTVFDRDDCNGVIAIGGGSAIDTAKAVSILNKPSAALSSNSQKVSLGDLFGENLVPKRTTPLICLPTTAGTGSEVTNISILLDINDELKKGIVSNELLPDVAIVAPELTLSCPPSVTAASGVDALVHAVESYLSKFASDITRPLSLQAIRMITESLTTAYQEPNNIEAREQMATASLIAGLAFGNAGVGAVHALAYPLGGKYHLSHGVSNAVMFSHVMRWNSESCPDKFVDIAIAMGAPTDGSINNSSGSAFVINKIKQLCEEVAIPQHLREFDIKHEDLKDLSESAIKATRLLRNNPRELSVEDIKAIYEEAY
ncbi:iron-containing alcohol dehydrogenase [Psychrobacter sp. H7-1]|uniref:iron-containing alcohol dehydrogenase n=1 Tax=Psychrobacter sp. H7-1 TaxID=1569265 RepID=UPI00191AD209|nr:iron-containing alcohol dehydrogenase [Psychrobacter sp. H7-1]